MQRGCLRLNLNIARTGARGIAAIKPPELHHIIRQNSSRKILPVVEVEAPTTLPEAPVSYYLPEKASDGAGPNFCGAAYVKICA